MIDGVYKIEDVFTRDQREKLIEDSQPLLMDGEELSKHMCASGHPDYGVGYQQGFNWYMVTHPTVHLHSGFEWGHQIILSKIKEKTGKDCEIQKSWMGVSNGDNGTLVWHNHKTCDYVGVYYMKMFPFFSNGTLFKDYGLIKAKENSLLLFPSHLDHSTPSSPLRFKRQCWSVNLKYASNT